jgi:hypothetical protein
LPLFLRVVVLAFALIVLISGIFLIFRIGIQTTSASYANDVAICNLPYSQKLGSGEATKSTCDVPINSWLVLSVHASSNVTITIQLESLINSRGQFSTSTLFSQSGKGYFWADFPITSSGVIIITVQNALQGYTSSITGYATVSSQVSTPVQYSSVVHPYRSYGEAMVVLGGVFLVLSIANPRRIISEPSQVISKLRGRRAADLPNRSRSGRRSCSCNTAQKQSR